MKVFGYLKEENLRKLFNISVGKPVIMFPNSFNIIPYLYMLVYRPSVNTKVYNLIYGPVLITHEFSPNITHLNVSVRKGDLIGVLIPRECIDGPDDDEFCPSQVNLPTNGNCPSAFFHSTDDIEMLRDIEASEFIEVPVDLSMEVNIAAGI